LLDLAGDDARDLAVVDGRGALSIYGGASLERLGGIDLGLGDGDGEWRLLPWDANADGFSDLLVAAPSGEACVVLRSGEDKWEVRSVRGLGGGGVLALWMQGGPGPSIVALGGDGKCRLHAATAAAENHVSVRLTGIKDNASGIGTRVELRAGSLFAADRVDPAPGSGGRRSAALHFALGGRRTADRVKVRWPNGVWEDSTQPARRVHIEQDPALLGSCPFLYAWNGERFEFVTDILGNAPLGLALAPGVYFPANPSERIALERLEPKDRFLELRLTEELRETIYIDEIALLAIDLPGAAKAFSSNALRPPPYPSEPFVVVGELFPPLSARDDRGVDRTETVRAKDGRYTGSDLAHHAAYQGLAERTHWIELDLGIEPGAKRVALVLHGGYWWSEAGNYAASQAIDVAVPPRLEVPDGRGGWRTAKSPFGFPGGRPKTVVHEIGELIEPSDPRVRIVTNFRLHWDRIAIDTTSTAIQRRTTRIEPSQAMLAFRGYSRAIDAGTPVPYGFDYEQVDLRRPYPRMTGAYTRFGDVLPLVTSADDRLVVMGHGEEIALRFDAASLPPLPEGFNRSFLFHSVGWDKDGDPKTAHGTTVEPLPFGGMSSYPFGEGEAWPAGDSLVGYVREWNGRIVSSAW
ncbi:MAG: hypothetical protein CME06_08175, partial [Gemmatimonadetes bacterium]|nr:hypothetical protein [Gemmatimonadota bacterium]